MSSAAQMVLGARSRNYLKEKPQVLDRTKALHGPRTQASGETNYLKEKPQVLDRTKTLHGPRTQASGETNYLQWKSYVTGTLESARGELPINNWLSP